MATTCIKLGDPALPSVCLQCGGPATVLVEQEFEFKQPTSSALALFFFFGVIIWRRPGVRLSLPFCDAHANHWGWRRVVGWSVFVISMSVSMVALLADHSFGLQLVMVALVISGLVAVVLDVTSIRASDVSHSGVTLTGVAEEFDQRLQACRDAYYQSLEDKFLESLPGPPAGATDEDENPFANLR